VGRRSLVICPGTFERFGPPLFIKRDNAGNLNHTSVNEVLEEHMVIPINSPYYTPSYNGAIEHCQGEFKTWLHQMEACRRIKKGTGASS
jgi:hypothetical protein